MSKLSWLRLIKVRDSLSNLCRSVEAQWFDSTFCASTNFLSLCVDHCARGLSLSCKTASGILGVPTSTLQPYLKKLKAEPPQPIVAAAADLPSSEPPTTEPATVPPDQPVSQPVPQAVAQPPELSNDESTLECGCDAVCAGECSAEQQAEVSDDPLRDALYKERYGLTYRDWCVANYMQPESTEAQSARHARQLQERVDTFTTSDVEPVTAEPSEQQEIQTVSLQQLDKEIAALDPKAKKLRVRIPRKAKTKVYALRAKKARFKAKPKRRDSKGRFCR